MDTPEQLLSWLRTVSGVPDLRFVTPPSRPTTGHSGSSLWFVEVAPAPDWLTGPLVIQFAARRRIQKDAAIRRAVSTASPTVPVPDTRLATWDDHEDGMGAAIMGRAPGRPLFIVDGVALRVARTMLAIHAIDCDTVVRELDAAGLSPRHYRDSEDRNLAFIAECAESVRAMRPLLEWLHRHRPAAGGDLVLCHGDLNFGNILHDRTTITAVLDWDEAAITTRWFDVGRTMAHLAAVPIYGRRMRRRFLATYRSAVAVDDAAVAWYEALWMARDLSLIMLWRTGRRPQPPTNDPFARTYVRHVQRLTGLRVRVPGARSLRVRALEYWSCVQVYQ